MPTPGSFLGGEGFWGLLMLLTECKCFHVSFGPAGRLHFSWPGASVIPQTL